MIGDDIEVTIVDILGNRVCLGIKAPKHVSVHRKEVYDTIKQSKFVHRINPGNMVK